MAKSKPRRVKLALPTVDSLGLCFTPKTNERARAAFVAVATLLCARTGGVGGWEHKKQLIPCGRVLQEWGLFTPEAVAALRELWATIHAVTEDAYGYGKKAGHSLLKQLASGGISLTEFNQATITEEVEPTDDED